MDGDTLATGLSSRFDPSLSSLTAQAKPFTEACLNIFLCFNGHIKMQIASAFSSSCHLVWLVYFFCRKFAIVIWESPLFSHERSFMIFLSASVANQLPRAVSTDT